MTTTILFTGFSLSWPFSNDNGPVYGSIMPCGSKQLCQCFGGICRSHCLCDISGGKMGSWACKQLCTLSTPPPTYQAPFFCLAYSFTMKRETAGSSKARATQHVHKVSPPRNRINNIRYSAIWVHMNSLDESRTSSFSAFCLSRSGLR